MAQEVVQLACRILKAQLDVIESRVAQRKGAPFVEPNSRRDQIAVVAESAGFAYQRFEIIALQRFAPGEPQLHRTDRTRLAQNAHPVVGRELGVMPYVIDGIGTKHAMQRTAIGELGEQPERITNL